MKAARINQYGDSNVIIVKETSVPELKEGQVLVDVYGASLNPIDYKIREGNLEQMFPDPNMVTLGTDFAGIIKEVSPEVTKFKVGDEVYGSASMLSGGSGSLAEFAAVKEINTALKPSSLDYIQSAALPLVGASALQAIEEHINIQQGQKILIQGGAGGIGSLAIQVAKMHGAFVATTVAEEGIEFVKGLGADLVIDYKKENFASRVIGYDAVFDTTGSDSMPSLKVLKKGGILVTMGAPIDMEKAKELGVSGIAQSTHTRTVVLERLASLIDEGKIKVEIDKEFSLDQVKEGFDYLEKDHPKGKVVISIKKPS